MADTQHQSQPMRYQIRLHGHLDKDWQDWFGDVTITSEDDGTTLMICQVLDQAALHGLLRQIRDLGLPLISVNRINSGSAEEPDVTS